MLLCMRVITVENKQRLGCYKQDSTGRQFSRMLTVSFRDVTDVKESRTFQKEMKCIEYNPRSGNFLCVGD